MLPPKKQILDRFGKIYNIMPTVSLFGSPQWEMSFHFITWSLLGVEKNDIVPVPSQYHPPPFALKSFPNLTPTEK